MRPSRSRISRLKRMMASSPSRLSAVGAGAASAFSSRLRPPVLPPKASASSLVRVRPLRLPLFSRASVLESARIHAGVSSSSSPPRRRRSPRSLRSIRSPRSRADRSSSEPMAGAGFHAGRPGAVRPLPPSRIPFVDDVEGRTDEVDPLGRAGLEGRPAAATTVEKPKSQPGEPH